MRQNSSYARKNNHMVVNRKKRWDRVALRIKDQRKEA